MLIVNFSYNDPMRAIERRAYLRVPDDVHIKHLIVTEDQRPRQVGIVHLVQLGVTDATGR